MKRSLLSLVALCCLSLIAFETRVAAKDVWVNVRSENFTLVGNASEGEIREAAIRLEQYHSLFARLFAKADAVRSVPTVVIVFKNDETFKPFRPLYEGQPSDVAGFFQPGRDVNYIAVSAERGGESAYRTIFHELAHLFIDRRLRGMPLALSEGLAEYYSLCKISESGKRVTLGREHVPHLRLLDERDLLPLSTLLTVDYNSAIYNERGSRSLFYAQSWAFAHYLLQTDEEEGLQKFSRFLELLADGATVENALSQAFRVNIAEMEKGFKQYARRPSFSTRVAVFDRPLEYAKEMHSARISEASAQSYMGDLLLHLNRLDEAEAYLQKALTLDANLVTAQASLGMLRLKQKRSSEAVSILRRAAAVDTQGFLTQYYFAYALSRESEGADGTIWGYATEAATEMRAALSRARELSPRFIEAYRLHAFVNLAMGEQLDEAEALLKHALALAPERQDVSLVLAQVHKRQLKFEAARQILKAILLRPDDRLLREQAQTLLEDVRYVEGLASRPEYIERMKRAAAQSPDAVAQGSEQAHSGRHTLARRFKGGERIRGTLAAIECTDTGIVISVKTGDRMLRVHGANLRQVFFVTYVAGLERTMTCGSRSPENPVVLTYRPSNNPRAKFDGEAIAIEFVPEDIDIEP